MNKVFIDRAVLEATLEHAEFVSGAACAADDAIRAVLAAPLPGTCGCTGMCEQRGLASDEVGIECEAVYGPAEPPELAAPSGTPVMPVKAYYHEAPNEHGGFNKSVGLEQRKIFRDAPLVLESDALAQIACLEGEIAKRDARIVELESELVLRREDHYRMDAELAAIKEQEPAAWVGAIEGGVPLLVVEPQNWKATPLYAAPVVNRKVTTECKRCSGTARVDIGTVCDNWVECPECAAPAAPAADEGVTGHD